MIDKSFAEYLYNAGYNQKDVRVIGEDTYIDEKLSKIEQPLVEPIIFSNLTGFAAFANEIEVPCFINIESISEISLISQEVNKDRNREIFAIARNENFRYSNFEFCGILQHDAISILMRNFILDDNLKKLLSIISKVKSSTISVSEDDGISQKVELTHSLALKTSEEISPIIELSPYSTFQELAEIPCKFMFRVTSRKDTPEFNLSWVSDNEWRVVGCIMISDFLKSLISNDNIDVLY